MREIEREFGKGKGKKLEEEIYGGADVFWDMMEGKKKKPKVKATMPKLLPVGRGNGYRRR